MAFDSTRETVDARHRALQTDAGLLRLNLRSIRHTPSEDLPIYTRERVDTVPRFRRLLEEAEVLLKGNSIQRGRPSRGICAVKGDDEVISIREYISSLSRSVLVSFQLAPA